MPSPEEKKDKSQNDFRLSLPGPCLKLLASMVTGQESTLLGTGSVGMNGPFLWMRLGDTSMPFSVAKIEIQKAGLTISLTPYFTV